MTGRVKDLTGKVFGRWTVLKYAGSSKHGKALWLCRCKCGTLKKVVGSNLINGGSVSCGCYELEIHTKHGMSDSRLYGTWRDMRYRCQNPNNKYYSIYGGKGVKVCREWDESFQTFYDWAMENGYKDNLTIDRIDGNGNYEPSNCRWATVKEQNRNLSSNRVVTFNGKTQCLAAWAEDVGITRGSMYRRIESPNFTLEEALTLPPIKCGKRILNGNSIAKQEK